MITPRFNCSQDDSTVIVELYVPSVRATDVEVHVEDTLFSVHIHPYFLRLNFPHPILEDDDSSASYDPSSGTLTVRLTKETKGTHFPDLDLLAKLLAPRSAATLNRESRNQGPLIQVLDDPAPTPDTLATQLDDKLQLDLEQEHAAFAQAAVNDWQIDQVAPDDELPGIGLAGVTRAAYGFLDLHTGYFVNVIHTENEVNELGAEAENSTLLRRRELREASEEAKWDEKYYIADYVDDHIIHELINWHPEADTTEDPFVFTDEENMTMLRLPRREYLLSPSRTQELNSTLCTILFAALYDWRTTQGDPTPESAWTICKLVPAFSALDPCPSLYSAWRTSYRRALAFPLYRSFVLCQRVQKDVAQLLARGTRAVTRRLLAAKKILDSHDVYYVYSKIWVDDFCTWLTSHTTDAELKALSSRVTSTRIAKSDIGWDLEELEQAAQDTQPDSDDEDEVEQMTPASL